MIKKTTNHPSHRGATLISARFIRLLTLLTVAVFWLHSFNTHATIWRVNNNGDTTADFEQLSEAVASQDVAAGDTIHLEGSPNRYGTATMNKRLVIIGPGYFLSENPDTQNSTLEAVVSFSFQSGTSGTVLQGITIRHRVSGIGLSADNLVVQQCRLLAETSLDGENILFTGNYVESSLYSDHNNVIRNNYLAIGVRGGNSNIIIENNIIGTGSSSFVSGDRYHIDVNNSTIRNNIFLGEDATVSLIEGGGNIITHNLSALDQLDASDNNVNNADLSSVFIGANGNSTDGRWHLATSSPAVGTGSNESDMGMFGGEVPYRLSGIPTIPRIIELEVPTQTSQEAGLTVRIKAASN